MITDMPTVSSESDLQNIRAEVKSFLACSGDTITDLAAKADVPRDFLYRFINDSYKYSPSFEYISRIIHACGRRIVLKKE